MWKKYLQPNKLESAVQALAAAPDATRIVAGGTDLLLELEADLRPEVTTLVDITRIPGLRSITLDEEGVIHLGPLVRHNDAVVSKLIVEQAFPLAQACWLVGAPQIRNRGTIAGNLVTASPANDTITPLIALGAGIALQSASGIREIPLKEFFAGVRKTALRPDEMVVDIFFPAMKANQRGTFIKVGLRKAQAISVLNAAILLTLDDNQVTAAAITLGAVAPTIIHAQEAEAYLIGKELDDSVIEEAARLAVEAASPIDDLRGSAAYRRYMVGVIVRRALTQLATGTQTEDFPVRPPILAMRNGSQASLSAELSHERSTMIETVVNGQSMSLPCRPGQTLLDLLRDEAGLTGTKEGCAEGECGACTVFLDGDAVMSCLVPAPRADGAEIMTVEGLKSEDALHPVQTAFIQDAAVQCGYCTPGFLMSAARLLEEIPQPNREQIKQALTGNLCRCTGYYKIVEAVEDAAKGG